MITLTKERNNIKIEISGTNGFYRFDINSGIFYGKKGEAIKSLPVSTYTLRTALGYNIGNQNLYNVISEMLLSEGKNTVHYSKDKWLSLYNIAEKLDGMEIPYFRSDSFMRCVAEHFEQFVKYVRKTKSDNTLMGQEWAENFTHYVEFEKAKDKLGKYYEYFTPKMYHEIIHNYSVELNEEIWGILAYYLIKQKVWEYHGNSAYCVVEYLNWCRYIGKTPEKTASFTREYIETKKAFELKKEKYDNEKMKKSFAKHKKAFEFTFGNYTIVIPKTVQDIVDEGVNMHHCVGSYAQSVVDGDQYIIFIRHKDTPNKCYITCQVHNNGEVGQYFLAYDRLISSETDKEFYNALKEHIRANW